MKLKRSRLLFAALLLAAAPFAYSELVDLKYDTVDMTVKGNKYTMEIANDDATIQFGLMKRTSLKPDRGMVFVFPAAGKYPFWMKNCFIDLDIIWLSPTGKVVEIVTMKAGDEVEKGGNADAQYVMELNPGTANKIGLKVGDTVEIPKKILVGAATQPGK